MRRRSILAALSSAALLLSTMAVPVVAQSEARTDTVTPGGTLPGAPSIELVKVAGGLADPVNIANAGDGSGRLFVVERVGLVRIIDQDGSLLDEPFLDIRDSVKTDFLEQGLLGLAFHPEYDDNGLFYVYYANYDSNGTLRLVQYEVSADDPDRADPDSAQLVLEIADDPYVNHNGGTVRFGPDGYLYWTTGDGGLAGDPFDNAQSIRNHLGKIFRIDVDTPESERPYSIPADNPFLEASKVSLDPQDAAAYHPGAVAEIWAYGLRNPWQFSFDPQTGDLYIADVGQNAWEEINFQEAGSAGGQNYGWDWLEGSNCYPETVTECPRGQVGVLPVAEYDHSSGDCSISGLGVARGDGSPALDGVYLASDFCSGRVWGLERGDDGAWIFQELLDTQLLVTGGGNGEAGDVYLTSCGCDFGRDYDPMADPQGAVWRVVQSDMVAEGAETAPPESAASPASSAAELTLTALDGSFDPAAIDLAADTDATIELTNAGALGHNLSIDALGIDVDIAPGESKEVTINAPAGTYEFYCDVPGHKELGMVGPLTVD